MIIIIHVVIRQVYCRRLFIMLSSVLYQGFTVGHTAKVAQQQLII